MDAPGNGCIFEIRKHTLFFVHFLNIIDIVIVLWRCKGNEK